MGRERKGSFQRSNGVLRLRIPVTVMRDGRQVTVRLWAVPDQTLTDEEAQAQAQAITRHFAGRVVDPDEVSRALRGERATRIDDFVLRVYLPTRAHQSTYAYQLRSWRSHVFPAIGSKEVHLFEADDLRRLVADLDRKVAAGEITWKFAVNVWGMVTKFCADLQKSKNRDIAIRTSNPARDVAGPDRGRRKKLQWLYPKELDRLLACEVVPVRWRRMYALYVYLFCRAGELPPLDFVHSIDLEHGMVTIDRKQNLRTGVVDHFTKADADALEARSFRIEPILLPLLRAMRDECGGVGPLFRSCDDGAAILRKHLLLADVTRPALHVATADGSMPIRLHDLRATGITYLAIRGDSDDDVRERAGHSDFETTRLYLRRGKRVGAEIGVPFAPLPDSLLRDPQRRSLPGGGYEDVQGRPWHLESSSETSKRKRETLETGPISRDSGVRRRGLEPLRAPPKREVSDTFEPSGLPEVPTRPPSAGAVDDNLDASRRFPLPVWALGLMAARLGVLPANRPEPEAANG